MTETFNKLSPAEIERLALLIEEAAEVQAIACKVLRHGYGSHNPDDAKAGNNRRQLAKEIGDLRYAIDLMVAFGDVPQEGIHIGRSSAEHKKPQYLHHQGKLP